MVVRQLWSVYAKLEASYGDDTINNIAGSDYIRVFKDTVNVNVVSDKVEQAGRPDNINKRGVVIETKRWVEFEFELPVMYDEGNGVPFGNLIRSAGFSYNDELNFKFTSANVGDSVAMLFEADNGHTIKAKGCRIEEMEVIAKVGEILRMRFKGKGLFVSESYTGSGITPTIVDNIPFKVVGGAMTGDLQDSFWTEFNIVVKNGIKEVLDANDQYGIKKFELVDREITGKFNPLGDVLGTKYPGNALNLGFALSSPNSLTIGLTGVDLEERSIGFDDGIQRAEVGFVIPASGSGDMYIEFEKVV